MTTKGHRQLRFSNPPVRDVELQVMFDRVDGLRITSVAALIEHFKADFPIADEKFNQFPWNDDESETEQASNTEIFSDDSRFPFPWLTFEDGSGNSIQFQDDRFHLGWSFSADRHYPGFDELRANLLSRFDEFQSSVSVHTSKKVNVRKVCLKYGNAAEGSTPFTVAALAFGAGEVDAPGDPSLAMSMSMFRAVAEFRDQGVETSVQFIAGEGRTPEPYLGVISTATPSEPEISLDMLIDTAHDRLTEVFSRLTTERQKTDWGLNND